jgi:hypothetical protein
VEEFPALALTEDEDESKGTLRAEVVRQVGIDETEPIRTVSLRFRQLAFRIDWHGLERMDAGSWRIEAGIWERDERDGLVMVAALLGGASLDDVNALLARDNLPTCSAAEWATFKERYGAAVIAHPTNILVLASVAGFLASRNELELFTRAAHAAGEVQAQGPRTASLASHYAKAQTGSALG